MISEEQLTLITAGIDGELTAEEARQLRELLIASPEARELYTQLRSDSDRVRSLPLIQPPLELRQRVIERVYASIPITPHPEQASPPLNSPKASSPTSPTSSWSRWIPIAIAASVLCGVTASSFWFFSHDSNLHADTNRRSQTNWMVALPSERSPAPAQPVEPNTDLITNSPMVQSHPAAPNPREYSASAVALAPQPRLASPEFHAFLAGAEIAPFDFVEVRIPLLLSVADLVREGVSQQVQLELSREPAFRIDLFVRDPLRGVELFESAARSTGMSVMIDSATADKLRKLQCRAVVIYTESLEPRDVARLLENLSARDAKVSPRIFDVVHMTPASTVEQKALTEIFGIDPGLFKRPGTTEKPRDTSKPLGSETVDHLVKSVASNSGKPQEKTAIVMAAYPTSARTPSASSIELKQFLAKRGLRQPNVVPVVFVIRQG
jgi:hypothetical protein